MSKHLSLVKKGRFFIVFGEKGCLFMSLNMAEALEKIEVLGGLK